MIDFVLPRMPWWVKVKLDRLVIPVTHHPTDGITKIHSRTRGDAKALGLLRVFKVEVTIDALLRWDCKKPTTNSVARNEYNLKSPNGKYNALFYTFKIRLELKKKKFPCFCYKCTRCEDIINKRGVFGYGPATCQSETAKYLADKQRRVVTTRRRRRRRRRRWFGKR